MKPIQGYHLITPDDMLWRPSNRMKIQNADFLERIAARISARGSGATLPKSAGTLHKHIRYTEFYFVLEGTGRMRLGDKTLTVPKHGGGLVGPEPLRQGFNDTDQKSWNCNPPPRPNPTSTSSTRPTQRNCPRNSPTRHGHLKSEPEAN